MHTTSDPISPDKSADDPQWYKDAVIYQVHIKSFFDANNDGIGDFAGLMEKLDYIVDLGVNTLWLLPFYPSPRRDDGYDIADYRSVHPDYGTLASARSFIAAAHARNLRVITELVINHTSDQHPWFQRAREAEPGSPARNFYVWSDSDQAYAGTRIIFVDSEKSNWTWDPVAKAYFWHRFYSHQPDLNFDNPEVLKEVLGVMRFWLELGVDGLRLDAVPYLVEREGTSNENLPETHQILKDIRADLDRAYPGRMLLAEANQWPEDAKDYFGDGDECHMAFHFPLMPRMYMAIAQEDRFPITDIMRQTPPIPDGCQWAIFLRNHDELTLEMVTSKERDYLWDVYAADRRARINLGIRRRLAPLLERDRRRIELMNSLLFSMPGTPVIYYGDEIGMGDNIHIGDRDGVRTPMQWTADRNGGFSRADPEQLVLPPVMGSLYGFESVNVESQARDVHSLLNWTRRMLALRREHRSFGRGTLRFIFPGNRKVFAYLREFEGEVILCVTNLSRTPQAVELDLAEFNGRVPVELLGGTSFPPIGELSYLLSLPPYAFYWFELSTIAEPPAWYQGTQERMPDQATLVLYNRTAYELTDASRDLMQREVLPPYLQRRRWFAAKGERIKKANIAYAALLPHFTDLYLCEVDVDLADRIEHYVLPLSLVWGEGMATPLADQLSLARVRRAASMGILTDAFALPTFAMAILNCLRANATVESTRGMIQFHGESGLSEVPTSDNVIQWLSAEQTNSSLIIDERAVLKIVRRVVAGVHPEAEMTRYLTHRGYQNTAALLGEVRRVDDQGTPHTLVIVQQFLPNQGDAWAWSLNYLGRTLEDVAVATEAGAAPVQPWLGYEVLARSIGKRLAELHAVLALPTDDPDFSPEVADPADVDAWASAAKLQLEAACNALAKVSAWPSDEVRQQAQAIVQARPALIEVAQRLAAFGLSSPKTRIHGDFHLGQVLVSKGDVYLIDVEGEPAQPLTKRRQKASPLRDVAGMMRSFDYAAVTARDGGNANAAVPVVALRDRRDALLEEFSRSASGAFRQAYQETISAAHSAVSTQAMGALLDLFLLEKAAYEICYEASNRPDWIGLPIRGLHALTLHLTATAKGT